MKWKTLTLTLLSAMAILHTQAQKNDTITVKVVDGRKLNEKAPVRKPYFGNSLDGMIFSTALIDNSGAQSLGTLRFSMFFHIGATYNYNISDHFGIYTGLDIKNIGYIEKFKLNDLTVKRRVYTAGIPIGLRIGNVEERNYFFLGGGVDFPFHYKVKSWSKLNPKSKFNEWFSEETEHILPYMFAGFAIKGTTLKVQYYPTNFLNEDYTDPNPGGIKPFAGKNVNMLLISIGRDMKFGRR